ncbi:MAG: CotH kinase family protein [Lachnospiraceae bacterium]|nr:CotH kinase family protein [Lachnospiraceae bacterium]
MKTKRSFILLSILLFLFSLIPVLSALYSPGLEGTLRIDPLYGNTLHIDEYDLDIYGIDRNGVTYFCLPSFINLTRIDMSDSPLRIFLEDGSVLDKPHVGDLQSINVETPEGSLVSWKIEFMRSANLNTVFLDLNDAKLSDIEHDTYTPVNVQIYSSSGTLEYNDGSAFIKGRGNATWKTDYFEPEKKPYELNFSEDVRIGELYPKKKWTLLANTYEGTKILNKMVLDAAVKIDMKYVSDCDWIDLYANGVYLGNYLVCSEPDDTLSSVILGGGWLVEKNDTYYKNKPFGFTTSSDAFSIKAPDDPTDTYVSDISAQVNRIDLAINNKDAISNNLVDLDSFVRWYMLEEIFYNEDALITSCFFYNSGSDDIIHAGPPWDFDNTCGEGGGRFLDYNGSILNEPEDRKPLDWYNTLCENPIFCARLSELFSEYAPVFDRLISRGIDEYYQRTGQSTQMDRAIYGIQGYGQDYTVPGYYTSTEDNIRYTKYFLSKRLQYLADKWGYAGSLSTIDTGNNSYHDVSFVYSDLEIKHVSVKDGDTLKGSDIPTLDPVLYKGWIYESNGLALSYFIPVYEDCRFIPEIRQEDTSNEQM